jgi:hypothetical protein
MLMLAAYMDESGHEADRVVIAGFWGDRTQWEEFGGRVEGRFGYQESPTHADFAMAQTRTLAAATFKVGTLAVPMWVEPTIRDRLRQRLR